MKKPSFLLILVSAVFMLNTCALEIANVIGPDDGYVFNDKGNYDHGWRYMQCSSFDHREIRVEITDVNKEDIIEEIDEYLRERSAKWYSFPWEIPTEADLRKMLNCFSYGLTKFSPDYYYLAVNNLYEDVNKPNGARNSVGDWEIVILHKSFDEKANGEVVKVTEFPEVVLVRAIRRF